MIPTGQQTKQKTLKTSLPTSLSKKKRRLKKWVAFVNLQFFFIFFKKFEIKSNYYNYSAVSMSAAGGITSKPDEARPFK